MRRDIAFHENNSVTDKIEYQISYIHLL